METQILGMAWFDEDDYDAFQALLPDRSWHPTFHAWLEVAEKSHQHLTTCGFRAVKVPVRSDTFAGWCRATGRDINTDALLAYSNEYALRVHQGHETH